MEKNNEDGGRPLSGGTSLKPRELSDLRQAIDRLDLQLLQLLSQRGLLAQEVWEAKKSQAPCVTRVYVPGREDQLIKNLLEHNQGPFSEGAVRSIFKTIISQSRALEQSLKIAFFGPSGSFTETAAHYHFGSAPIFEACISIDEVFQMVQQCHADYGVIPIENSTEGPVGQTLDLLVTKSVSIVSEVLIPIRQNLLSCCNDLSEIKAIYGHPQSLSQTRQWLDRHFSSEIKRIEVANNALGAQLAKTEPSTAAIASLTAAQLYDIPVLRQGIEDNSSNRTRFAVIASEPALTASGEDKTSLVCSAAHHAGSMYHLLEPLSRFGVSMTKLESRPAGSITAGCFEYVFFIDLEGHLEDDAVQNALHQMKKHTSFLKILGSYPKADLADLKQL